MRPPFGAGRRGRAGEGRVAGDGTTQAAADTGRLRTLFALAFSTAFLAILVFGGC